MDVRSGEELEETDYLREPVCKTHSQKMKSLTRKPQLIFEVEEP